MGLFCFPFYSFCQGKDVKLCWTVFSSADAVHWCVYDTDAKSIVDLFSRCFSDFVRRVLYLFVM